MSAYMLTASVAASTLLVSIEAALAGPTVATPGPIAAVGVPSLILLGGAFLAVRYFRSSRK